MGTCKDKLQSELQVAVLGNRASVSCPQLCRVQLSSLLQYLTHIKLLFMSPGRRVHRESWPLDWRYPVSCEVQSSRCAGSGERVSGPPQPPGTRQPRPWWGEMASEPQKEAGRGLEGARCQPPIASCDVGFLFSKGAMMPPPPSGVDPSIKQAVTIGPRLAPAVRTHSELYS